MQSESCMELIQVTVRQMRIVQSCLLIKVEADNLVRLRSADDSIVTWLRVVTVSSNKNSYCVRQ